MSYSTQVEHLSPPPFVLEAFLEQLELRRHADHAATLPSDQYPAGVIGLLSMNWEGPNKSQHVSYSDMQGNPLTFDILSDEDKEKRLHVGRSTRILEQDGKEIAHLTSVRTEESHITNKENSEFIAPQPVFSQTEITIVGENPEELENNIVFIRALLQGYLEYYSSLPKAEFVPREIKRYHKEVSVVADGETHPLFDHTKFPVPQDELAMAAD